MARQPLTADEAAATLHRSARARMTPVARLAAEVVASTSEDIGPEPIGQACG